MTLVKFNHPAAKTFDGFFNDLWQDLPANFSKNYRHDVAGFPPVNIIENAGSYQLELSVPGWDKTDFNVKLDGALLTVSAEKKEAQAAEGEKLVRKEFSSKSFKRSFTLDEKIQADAIEAKYENGILKLTLPKKEVAKVVAKEITIQ